MVIGLAACLSTPRQPSTPIPNPEPPAVVAPPPVPDVIPRSEPRARKGNPPFYQVFGKRYYVLSSSVGYWERGVASWYGPGFHKVRTSTGELYDMYGMTAAHKTLPLPAYVRVTNLQNGRSVVVRVNDRGPFVGNRIIDLSYTAAARLDMLRDGTAMVDVRSLDASVPPVITASTAPLPGAVTANPPSKTQPGAVAPSASSAANAANAAGIIGTANATGTAGTVGTANATGTASTMGTASATAAASPANGAGTTAPGSPLFVQAGAFSDPANAERLAARLRGGSFGKIFVREDQIAGRRMYRVRIGPVSGVAEFDRVVAALERAGITDAHLALD
jgi:rare lipoprotein A